MPIFIDDGAIEQPFQYRHFLRLLWLYYNIGLNDFADWSRALLAWKYQLTRDEMAVVELIAAGLENKEISVHLGLTDEDAAKNRIKSVFRKMHVARRAQVAAIAGLFGLGDATGHSPAPNE